MLQQLREKKCCFLAISIVAFCQPSHAQPERKQLKSLFNSLNLKQIINSPTRVAQTSKSLIDRIVTNCSHNISESGVISAHLSNHNMVYCVLKLNWKRAPGQLKIFRNYAKYSPSDFCNDLNEIKWDSRSSLVEGLVANVDELWNDFKASFVAVAERHVPVIQKRVRGVDNCPWMNKIIKAAMRQRNYLLSKAKKTNNYEDWANYRRCRNRVTNDTKRAKASYNRRLIDECGDDHKAFWRTMKKILPGEKQSATSCIRAGETFNSDKKSMANSFNKFFTNVSNCLRDSMWYLNVSNQSICSPFNYGHPSFKFEEVSEAFVKSKLRGLKAGKAVGLDDVPARLLIDSADIVARPLTDIINVSLQTGQVPIDWKAARVFPLFKKGRPISVL